MVVDLDENLDHSYATGILNNEIRFSATNKQKIVYSNELDQRKPITTTYLDSVFKYLEQIYLASDPMKVFSGNNALSNEFDSMIKSIATANSLDAIVAACNQLEIVYEENSFGQLMGARGIKCVKCYDKEGKRSGMFAIKLNECFTSETEKVLPQKFRSTKSHIKDHFLNQKQSINASADTEYVPEIVATQKDLQEKLEQLTSTIVETKKRLLPQKAPKSQNENVNMVLARATSVSGIVESFKHLAYHFPSEQREAKNEFDAIICVSCFKPDQDPTNKHRTGFFAYDFGLGTLFGGRKLGQKIQRPEFKQLKSSISYHLSSKLHLLGVQETYIPSEKENEQQSKTHDRGMAIAKVALRCAVRTHSKRMFEEDLAFLADIGFSVGDINHSVHFVNNIIPEMYTLEPSPFVVFANKITPYCETLQIIGVIFLRNGKNESLVLDILPVLNHDGKSLAKDIVDTIHLFYSPELARKLYVGSSFDGQYFQLGVPNHMLSLLKITYPQNLSKEEQGQIYFHSISWDPAHLIELGCGDVKKSKLYCWVEKTEKAIVSVNRRNTYGKNYLELKEEFKAVDLSMKKQLLRPGSFCETRFAAYKYQLLFRFDNNYEAIYNKLAKEGDDYLNLINCAQFCLRLCALQDIFKLIGETSQKVQSSKIYPWHADAIIEKCMENLTSMADSLSLLPLELSNTLLKKFNSAIIEMSEHGTFHNKPVYYRQVVAHATRSETSNAQQDTSFTKVIERVCKEIAKYIHDLVLSIQTRFCKIHEQKTFLVGRDAFSLQQILLRSSEETPDSFVEYCSLARNIGFISNLPQEILNSQYKTLTKTIHEISSQYCTGEQSEVDESGFYEFLLSSCDQLKGNNEVLHLFASAIVRNKSECLAESLGSMVKHHLDQRCRLTKEHLAQEVFLHFNGPVPNRESDGLVRAALTNWFNGPDWHFSRTSASNDLVLYEHSKVIDRVHCRKERVIVEDLVGEPLPD